MVSGAGRSGIQRPPIFLPPATTKDPAITQVSNVHNLWKNLLITKWGREVNSK
ncbi:MAG: hypothetical protein ACLPUO_21340 [Streptosporangiaceae bacterium]|jgi:hypothetical protein